MDQYEFHINVVNKLTKALEAEQKKTDYFLKKAKTLGYDPAKDININPDYKEPPKQEAKKATSKKRTVKNEHNTGETV